MARTGRTDPAPPVQARALRKRARLVEAAAGEFADRGYAAATARTIARRAGVAVGTFYRHFRDKDAVLRELATALHAELFPPGRLAGLSEGGPQRALLAAARALVREALGQTLATMQRVAGLASVLEARRLADPALAAALRDARRSVLARGEAFLRRLGVERHPATLAAVLYHAVEATLRAQVAEPIADDGVLLDTLGDLVVAACPRER